MSSPEKQSQNSLSGRKLARNTLYNLLSYALPILLGLITIPFIIKGMGTERFGYLTLAWAVIGYFNLFDFGLGRAATQFIGEKLGKGQHKDIPALAYTTTLLLIAFGLVGSVLLFLLTPYLVGGLLNIPPALQQEATLSLQLLSASLPLVTVTSGFRGILEAYQRFDIISLLRIPHGAWMFVSPLLALLITDSLTLVIALLILGRALIVVLYFHFFRKNVGKAEKSDWRRPSDIKMLLRFGGWMSVTNIVGPFLIYMDRFMIGSLMTLTFVSYYTTPFEIVSRLLIIPAAITGVMFPAMAQTFVSRPQQATRLYFRGLVIVLAFTFPVVIASYILAEPALELWLGQEFASNSSLVLQILMLGILVNALAHIPFSLIQAAGYPHITAKLHLVELPIYIGLVYYLTSNYGIVGTAIAWSLRVLFDAVALFILSRRLLDIDLTVYRKQIALIALALAMASALLYTTTLQPVLGTAALLAFIPLTWKLGLMNEDKQRLRKRLGI